MPNAATIAISANDEILLFILFLLFSYGRKHRPCEALKAGVPPGHPLASACCGIVTTASTITTPSNASAASMPITAIDEVLLFILSSSILFYLGLKHLPLLFSKDLLTASPLSHPASASCVGIVITASTITTPSTPSATTMAITVIDIIVLSSLMNRLFFFVNKTNKQRLNALLKIKSERNCNTIYREAR